MGDAIGRDWPLSAYRFGVGFAAVAFFGRGSRRSRARKSLADGMKWGTGNGFSLVESDDPMAVSKLAIAWADLVDQKTVAVVEDAQIAAALQ